MLLPFHLVVGRKGAAKGAMGATASRAVSWLLSLCTTHLPERFVPLAGRSLMSISSYYQLQGRSWVFLCGDGGHRISSRLGQN